MKEASLKILIILCAFVTLGVISAVMTSPGVLVGAELLQMISSVALVHIAYSLNDICKNQTKPPAE